MKKSSRFAASFQENSKGKTFLEKIFHSFYDVHLCPPPLEKDPPQLVATPAPTPMVLHVSVHQLKVLTGIDFAFCDRSAKRAKLHTAVATNNRITRHDHSLIACSRHIGSVLSAHVTSRHEICKQCLRVTVERL